MSEEDKKGLILLDLGGTLTSIPYSDQGPFLDTIKADYKAVILTTSIEEAKIYFDELAKYIAEVEEVEIPADKWPEIREGRKTDPSIYENIYPEFKGRRILIDDEKGNVITAHAAGLTGLWYCSDPRRTPEVRLYLGNHEWSEKMPLEQAVEQMTATWKAPQPSADGLRKTASKVLEEQPKI